MLAGKHYAIADRKNDTYSLKIFQFNNEFCKPRKIYSTNLLNFEGKFSCLRCFSLFCEGSFFKAKLAVAINQQNSGCSRTIAGYIDKNGRQRFFPFVTYTRTGKVLVVCFVLIAQ